MLKKLLFSMIVATACLPQGAMARGVTVVQGAGTAQAINAFQFAGSGNLRLGQTPVSETSLATLISLGPGPGGSLVGASTHDFNLGAMGTITTLDEVRLTPIDAFGNFRLQIKSDITGGTGDFAGATGRLTFNGTANLVTGAVVWKVHGQIN